MSAVLQPEWQLQDAKNKLSQVVKAAGEGVPQWVTVHGKRAAVLMSAADYAALKSKPNMPWPGDLLCPGLFSDAEGDALFGRNRNLETRRKLKV
jgi:antitoxin Phd